MKGNPPSEPLGFSFSGLLRLVRFGNILIIASTQFLGALFLAGRGQPWTDIAYDPKLYLLILSTMLIAGAGYIINDYYDVKIDYINRPGRVLIGPVMKRRVAMVLHFSFNLVGIVLGLIVSPFIGIIDFVAAFILWLYSAQLKKFPLIGNFAVSLLTGTALMVLSIYYPQNQILIAAYAFFAFTLTLVREIIKDMEDVKGDQKFGLKTLPIVWGIRKTKSLLFSILILFIVSLYFFMTKISIEAFSYFFWCMVPFTLYYFYLLIKADTKKAYGFLSNYTKFIMLSGVISMVLI